jgi:hypothetical protein
MATQTLEHVQDAINGAEEEFAAGGEAGAKITAQAQRIAAALEGHDAAGGSGGGGGGASSTGSGSLIADTDDLTALMLMVRFGWFIQMRLVGNRCAHD